MPERESDSTTNRQELSTWRLKRLEDNEKQIWEAIGKLEKEKASVVQHDRLEERQRMSELAIVNLKVRASVWGGLAGLLPVVMWLALRAIAGVGK